MSRKRKKVVATVCGLVIVVSLYAASQFFNFGDTPPLTDRHKDDSVGTRLPPTQTTTVLEALSDDIEKVAAAWRRREIQTQSLYCKWIAETIWPSGPIGYPQNEKMAELAKDTTVNETLECTFAGSSLRFSHSGPKWNDKAARFMPRLHLSLTNDEANLDYFGGDGLGGKYNHPFAQYQKPGGENSSKHFHLTPLFFIFRPFDAQFGESFEFGNVERISSDSSHGKLKGLVGKKIVAGGDMYPNYILWVDEDRDYLPTRVEGYFQEELCMECEITYQEAEDDVWMPENWKTTTYGSAQKVILSTTCRVVTCIKNPKLMEEAFTFTLPDSTVVTDLRTGEYYLLRPDGTKRHITKEELVPDVTYATMLATESGEGVSPEYKALIDRIEAFSEKPLEMRLAIVDDVIGYYNSSQNARATDHIAMVISGQLLASGQTGEAAATLRVIAHSLGEGWEHLLRSADEIEGSERLENVVGQEFRLIGTTLNGDEFNLNAMRDKIVLVTFWNSGCRPCIEEFAELNKVYQNFRDKGFDIVGVTSDRNVESIKKILDGRGVPWLNLYCSGDGPQASIEHYGISTFPTNVLVGRDGKVISVSNDCSGLQMRVAELVAQTR